MKAALILLLVAVGIAVAYAGLTCLTDKEKCQEDECCIKTGPVGRCKKVQQEDQRCEMHPGKMLFPDHVYRVMCPCATGLKCVAKDGIIGKLIGTCTPDSSEVVEPDTE